MSRVPGVAPPPIAVIGGASTTPALAELAAEVGRGIAERGGVLLCGGRGGIMEHAARGAREAGGVTLGILPGRPGHENPNPHLEHRIFTGMGQARNQILVLSAAAVVAIGGGWGTLSEIALALKQGVPVVQLAGSAVRPPGGGEEPLLFRAQTPAEAVAAAFANARSLS